MKLIFISPGGDVSNRMFAELYKLEQDNFTYIDVPVILKNKLYGKIFRLYYKIAQKIDLHLDFLFNRAGVINTIDFDNKEKNYIIMGNGCFNYYSARFLNKIKEKNNIGYIVYFIDPLSHLTSKKMRENIFSLNYDTLISFSKSDAEKLNGIYSTSFYSKLPVQKAEKQKAGVYFVGNNKGRLKILHEIYQQLNNHVECKFKIFNVEDKDQKEKNIIYNSYLPYEEILKEIQEYNCILEINQSDQDGVTLRYYEAVVYNKKLITNNLMVKSMPYYDEKYMYVFERPEDINYNELIQWIKEDVRVDYKYDGRFSPICLIKEIEQLHLKN